MEDDLDMFISFEESNVEDIFDITVIHEILKDDGKLSLNPQQIQNEVLNLLYDKYSQDEIVHIVNDYMRMFTNQKKQVRYTSNKPIIIYNKTNYVEKNTVIDEDYDNSNYYKSQVFEDYLNQFNKLNRDRSNVPYKVIASKLYALSKPFAPHTSTNINKIPIVNTEDTESYHYKIISEGIIQDYRIIGKVSDIYPGDEVELCGYFNLVDEINPSKFITINFNDYFDNISNLQIGDKVIVEYNDIVLSDLDKQLGFGEVIEITNTKIVVLIGDETLDYIKKEYNPFFIYHVNYPIDKLYSKRLLTDNIVFLICKDIDILPFIQPINASEILYIHVKNNEKCMYSDISRLLKPYDLDIYDLSVNCKVLIKYLINTNLPKPKALITKVPGKAYNPKLQLLDFKKYLDKTQEYPDYNAFSDSDINRLAFLRKQKPLEYSYIFDILNQNKQEFYKSFKFDYEKIKEKIHEELDKLASQKNLFKVPCNKKYTYAKIYHNYNDLIEDNDNDVIYFDKKFDKTNYNIKNEIMQKHPNINNNKLQLLIIKELTSRFPELSTEESEFEAMTIINGKRRIRAGDHAMLVDETSTTIYNRQLVQDVFIWIKVGRVPYRLFEMCNDELQTFDELIKDNVCVVDSYDSICKNAQIIRLNRQYNELISQLENVEDIAKNMAYDFSSNFSSKSVYNMGFRSAIFSDITYKSTVNYTDYSGTESLDLDFNLDFNEKGQYELLQDKNKNNKNNENILNIDLLDIFEDFTELGLDSNIQNYILTYANLKHEDPSYTMYQNVKAETDKLFKAVNKDLYDKQPKYKQLFDSKVEEKINMYTENINKNYYKNLIITIASMIVLIIRIMYPHKLLSKIMPKCLQYLSYNIDKDSNKSLIKYFSCLVKTIGSPNDIKFANFSLLSVDQIEKLINDEIEHILSEKYDLQMKLEENKEQEHLENIKVYNYQDFYMFKPNPNVNRIDKKFEQLKIMNQKIKTTKNIKEKLTCTFNYYDFFEIKFADQNQNQKNKNIYPETLFLKAVKDTDQIENLFESSEILIDSNMIGSYSPDINIPKYTEAILEYNNEFLNTSISNFNNEEWWSNIFYTSLSKTMKNLNDQMSKYPLYVSEYMEYLSNTIIMLTNINNLYNIRDILLKFLDTNLPLLISRIFNNYKPDIKDEDKIPEFFIVLETLTKDTKFMALKPQIYAILKYTKKINLLNFDSDKSEDLITKNVSVLAYIIITLFDDIVKLSSKNTNIFMFLQLLIFELVKKLKDNDNNLDLLKKSIEELREKKKQALLDAYNQDDEERELQMLLKKIGITAWADTGAEKPDVNLDEDLSKIKNQEEEDENYKLKGYKTANGDDLDLNDDDNDNDAELNYDD
jgi:hypothetical protein